MQGELVALWQRSGFTALLWRTTWKKRCSWPTA
jgi:hypothetical protein